MAPGISRLEGFSKVHEADRITVGGDDFVADPQLIYWMEQNTYRCGAVYWLTDQHPREALSIEPLFSHAIAEASILEQRAILADAERWAETGERDLETRPNTLVTLTPFMVTQNDNTIDAFRNNMSGLLSSQQVRHVWQAQRIYELNPTQELWEAPPPEMPQWRDDIHYIEGNPRFCYHYGGGRKFTSVTIDDKHFRVQQDLWDEMKAIGARMGVHYLKPMSTPILLYIQPLRLRDLPSEEDLERVVGIDTDGEFVYEDDVGKKSDEKPNTSINLG